MRILDREFATLDELHQFVHQTLCEAENLLPDQFRTIQRALVTQGQLCGMEYTLVGLRSVRLSAIWAADQNVVFLYDAKGERTLKVRLQRRPTDTPQVIESLGLNAA